jgi:hypothetical protein
MKNSFSVSALIRVFRGQVRIRLRLTALCDYAGLTVEALWQSKEDESISR